MPEASQPTMPQPGPEHARLKPFEGEFRAQVKIFMGPGDPEVSQGLMTNTFQLGGLYLHQDYVGDEVEGSPYPSFCGQGYWGFNSISQKYEGFWIDNASPMMQMETGTVDEAGTVWTMESETQMPDGQTLRRRSVITIVDNDRHRNEMYFVQADGSEVKSMEIDFERA